MGADYKPIPTPWTKQLKEAVNSFGPVVVFGGTVMAAAHLWRTNISPTRAPSELDALRMPPIAEVYHAEKATNAPASGGIFAAPDAKLFGTAGKIMK